MRSPSLNHLHILASIIQVSIAVPLNALPWSDVNLLSDDFESVNARHAQGNLEKRGNCCGRPLAVAEVAFPDTSSTSDPGSDPQGSLTPDSTHQGASTDQNTPGGSLPAVVEEHASDYSSLIAAGRPDQSSQADMRMYANEWGEQLPLAVIRRNFGERGLDAVWDNADRRGRAMRATLDYYVGNNRRRLDDGGPQPIDFNDVYEVQEVYNPQARFFHEHLEPVYTAVGISPQDIQNNVDYYECKVLSKGEEAQPGIPPGINPGTLPVLAAAINVGLQTIVVYEMFAFGDGNTGADRLYSSELLFQLFRDVAETYATEKGQAFDENALKLKYIIQDTITNQETRNVMRLMHLTAVGTTNWDGRDVITGIPDAAPGYGQALGPETGQGRWLPEHPLFNRLLSVPNVRTTVQLLIDHNTEVTNPYPAVLHTFPRRISTKDNGVQMKDSRDAFIVIELGTMPPAAVSLPGSPALPRPNPDQGSSGTVQTS